MVADRLTRAVREQLTLGRLLPLGGPADGAWLTEQAAQRVLRSAESRVAGARLGMVRIGLAEPAGTARPVVPAPVSALPPGPLRIGVTCVVTAGRPLRTVAQELRTALHRCAVDRLGLEIDSIDLRVTALLEELPPPGPPAAPAHVRKPHIGADMVAVAGAVRAVPGVAALTPVLGGSAQPVRAEDRTDADGAPLGRHVEVQLAVAEGHRALDVARAVRATVGRTVAAPATVAVLVTDVR
ncbi:nucleopolyhedrovirus P10 family protein [Streptomyces pactum]|uniref:Nucleopolyhedrovirus P10 family protein n=1 Tax=Streptomyces pactum TaxID=68249 RepID=A0ABS0NGB1_9ACTN|nr:nucleopolyhedrovirus P10 family protein [Streptomyces pactum]